MARGRGGKGRGGPLRMVERLGVNRGVFGGSKGWFYVGTGLWTLRTVRRMAARNVDVLLTEELKPGDRIVIANGRATIDSAPTDGAAGRGSSRRRKRR